MKLSDNTARSLMLICLLATCFAAHADVRNVPVDCADVPAGASFPETTSGPGEYALIRTVGETTNDAWQIIRGQVSDYINASYVADTNWTTIKFYFNGQNDQTHTVPAGVTQAIVKCWGAGGKTGANNTAGTGGSTVQPTPVIPGNVFTVRVGCTGTSTNGGWPGGGNPDKHTYNYGSGGGGYSGVFVGTNIICIAGGGGGGSYYTSTGANGGGMTGGQAAKSGSGAGGTQTSGGGNGSYLQGGNGIYTGGALAGGGGGGGYYGGGGGGYFAAGGGGSGYISSDLGSSYQGVVTEDEDYESGIGVANGNGMIVIKYRTPTEQ